MALPIWRDFDFVATLAELFFKQSHIQKRLALIEEKTITGWEIWLQVEFSVFLQAQASVSYWEREYPFTIDSRQASSRKSMAIDFLFRKKYAKSDQSIALELKQNTSVRSCIKGMMLDTCKVASATDMLDSLRSIWSLGIHPQVPQSEMDKIIKHYASKLDVALIPSCILTKPIANTQLAYTIF